MKPGSKNGAVWRRWDLHLHPPGTKMSNGYGNSSPEIDEKYIDALEASPIEVFGITDYFSCDRSFEIIDAFHKRHPDSPKAFFINIEFRLSDAINAASDSPHLHVIFDSDEQFCPRRKIEKFLQLLTTKGVDRSGASISCAELSKPADYESASVAFEDLNKKLNEAFGDSQPYLLAFPAKNDGMKSTDMSSPRKVRVADNIDRICHAFLGYGASRDHFLRKDRYDDGQSEPKPVIWGSDAHSFEDLERLQGNIPSYPYTWIKADTTFRGLQQICYEPEARVFIGEEPPVETRKIQHPTKILRGLKIGQVRGYDGAQGQWFKNVDLPLNPELTAIIGNKGSGKSALVDIIGLLGESRLEEYFAFLSDSPENKKFRQRRYAENFEAELEWQSGSLTAKRLSDHVESTKPELVRYLPQNYFEKLTNEIQIEKFRRQIEDVVFSHVDETEQMGQASFKELQDLKTLRSKDETSALKTRLRAQNVNLVALEEQADPQFRRTLKAQLDAKYNELNALAKPEVMDAPDDIETPEQKVLSATVEQYSAQLTALRSREQPAIEYLAELKRKKQVLEGVNESLESLTKRVADAVEQIRSDLGKFGLDADQIVSLRIQNAALLSLAADLTNQIGKLEANNELTFEHGFDFSTLESLPDIRKAIDHLVDAVNLARDKLSAPRRAYQQYLERLDAWKSRNILITGNETDPQPNTIRYIESQITALDNDLPAKIVAAREARRKLVEAIYASKNKILKFYADLKKSVDTKLSEVAIEGFSVEIDASFVLSKDFQDSFLSKVSKNKRGPFNGQIKEPGQTLSDFLRDVSWNDFAAISAGLDRILDAMQTEDLKFTDQVRDQKEFYDFLFSLEYIEPSYKLRLSGKDLEELSPGEKGLLLLVFYLQLDKNDIPLIIDQPEDNLDNQSIFSVLSNCIRTAKKRRQVVLVTHNPNLAVGADAEQIVYVKLDKTKNYKFSYESGAIENPNINRRIVDVLEGSQPAFVKRRLKYKF
ncbi:TrlF family AAA-like ATPase [Mesorhizobium sp. M0027]|uniref:TrlF family AAA-like ATPase n=1 Tax=Mesorhizobium sp. M0027 TaxID=2956848 RepID=UPI003334AC3E